MNLKIKFKYATQLRRSSYLEVLSLQEWTVDLTTLNNRDLEICEIFSLQLDESTDVCDASQLLVFIRMVFNDGKIKKELLKTITLHAKTRGEDTDLTAKLNELNTELQGYKTRH
jgi:hypothetical protein